MEFQALVQSIFGDLLGAQTDVPAVVAREVVTPDGGRIDVLAIDANGVISVCECKLERNAGARREVLGQVLEYGGALHGMALDDFLDRVTSALHREDQSSGDVIEEMSQLVDDWAPEQWRSQVASALNDGQFRLIVAVDTLTPALRRSIEFVNDRANFPLVAIELRRLEIAGQHVLAPALYGEEIAQRKLRRVSQAPARVVDADTLIVPSTKALTEFEQYSAYICQPDRPIKDGSRYLGFYGQRRIDRRFPRIVDVRPRVSFTNQTATSLSHGSEEDRKAADVIKRSLEDKSREEGEDYELVLLDPSQGFQLKEPIEHPQDVSRAAWTQNFRYTRRDALETQPKTTADLREAGG